MKKVFDQTVRDIKREVNKKVLKVPGIEQKVLDATSNEPWGPHGTLLAEIAQATRNYHEYQMIMAVIWKRINDTGKNWRHVYKALTVLEYLVGYGSERVIDDIREHSHQISMLSDFQYIDSSGRDQGSNVRRKSQSLVALVNDKERIIEVRQKAAANRDKFHNTSAGGMYRPGSYSSSGAYGDRYDYDRYEGRYGSRDDDQNGYGYGREREYGYRDDDRYGRYGDSNSRDGDRYGRDSEDRHGRDGSREDDYRGRSRSVDGYQDGSGRNSDGNRSFDDDSQLSSGLERKFSEQNVGAPLSYEGAVSESRSPIHSERENGENLGPTGPGASFPSATPGTASLPAASGGSSPPLPPGSASPPAAQGSISLPASHHLSQGTDNFGNSTSANQEILSSDEFDPRGSVSASTTMSNSGVPTTSNSAEMDFLGPLSDPFSSNTLAIMPVMPATSTAEADANSNSGSISTVTPSQSASNVVNQTFEDPFGDSPFKAIPSTETAPAQQHISASITPFDTTLNQSTEMPQSAPPKVESVSNFDNSFYGISYTAPNVSNLQSSAANTQFLPQELSTPQQETDILADILPPSGPSPAVPSSQVAFPTPTGQPAHPSANMYGSFHPQMSYMPPVASNVAPQMSSKPAAQLTGGNFISQGSSAATVASYIAPQTMGSMTPIVSNAAPQMSSGSAPQLSSDNFISQGSSAAPVSCYMVHQTPAGPAAQFNSGNFLQHQGSVVPAASQVAHQIATGPSPQQNNDVLNFLPQASNPPTSSQPALPSTGSLAMVQQSQPSQDKFEPKSAIWADTLSRGLVNLNISGPKANPLADIGVDFDAINRKEKRMEKQSPQTAVPSTVTMGKAMGSGSGLGRAGASTLWVPNPVMGSSMGMSGGPSGGMGVGMGMVGYGGMNQSIGVRMNTSMNMGAGMNMRMEQGVQMQPQTGMAPGSTMPAGYNPMMGAGGYSPQQPYGGGY